MSKDLKDKIVQHIQEDGIAPKPKWHFLLKDGVVWCSAGLVIFLGAHAVAASIAIFRMHDWDLSERLGRAPLTELLLALPYAWILVFIGFVALADYNIRHTKTGYKFTLWKLVTGVVTLSALFGMSLYAVGAGHTLDKTFAEHVPLYERIGNRRAVHLLHPEQGVLAGRIQAVDEEKEMLQLKDMTQTVWTVYYEEAALLGEEFIVVGKGIRILGEIEDDEAYAFEAEEIIPLRPPREAERMIRIHRQERRDAPPDEERALRDSRSPPMRSPLSQ